MVAQPVGRGGRPSGAYVFELGFQALLGIRDVDDANGSVIEKLDQASEDPRATITRDVLQHDEAVDQIEPLRNGRQIVIGLHEGDVADFSLIAVGPSLAEHALGHVYAAHRTASRGEWDDHAADSATEVEGPRWLELRVETRTYHVEHVGDVRLTHLEEVASGVRIQIGSVELVEGHDSPVWVVRAEELPIRIRVAFFASAVGAVWR